MSRPRLILIADDDPHIREVVRYALEKAGFQTAQAADGRETVEQFLSLQPDLLVLDIVMPEMDGTEVCRQIRSHSPPRSSFCHPAMKKWIASSAWNWGATTMSPKPFSPRELVARVKAVLRRSEKRVRQWLTARTDRRKGPATRLFGSGHGPF